MNLNGWYRGLELTERAVKIRRYCIDDFNGIWQATAVARILLGISA